MMTNEEVPNKTNSKKQHHVRHIKMTNCFFGHIMRKDELVHLTVTGRIVEKRARGRMRTLCT